MKTVVIIQEDDHGIIGIAKDYLSTIKFLLIHDWLNENFEMYYNDYNGYCNCKTIKENLGENWREVILTWDIEKFNEYFNGSLYLTIEAVHGT